MSEQDNSTAVNLFAPRQKRKYTKRDFFVELSKKVCIWKSILQQFERVQESYKKREAINLSGMQEKVSKYLEDLAAKEGKLLYASEKILNLYTKLQELANKEPDSFIFDYSNTLRVKNMRRESLISLIENYADLQTERRVQNQRTRDIQTLINFEKKQIQIETKKKKEEKERPNSNASLLQIASQRILTLYRRVRQDQNQIKGIQLGLQKKAKELFQVGEEWFSEKVVNDCIAEFQEIYSGLEMALTREEQFKKQLKASLESMKKIVEEEKIKLNQQKAVKKQMEKNPEEKIQESFDIALQNDKNLVLVGLHRSLGLTNAVIKEIVKDEEYKQDIIEHMLGLLETPQGQDFGKAGNSRWKPIQDRGLYELSVNPKNGHSQNMPRLYAKKENFVQKGTVIELTNNRDNRKKESIWVLVRKGKKGTQSNDIDAAEKVFFENDGKQCGDNIVRNNLEWIKTSLIPQSNQTLLHVVVGRPGY